MTEDPPPEDLEDVDPSEDAVRRLLAQARVDEPMPPEVVARLDAVLAGLSPEQVERPPSVEATSPVEPGETATVTALPVHRRRGAAALLVAAAVIVVGGVVVAQHLQTTDSESAASSATDNRASEVAGGSTSKVEPQASATAPGPHYGPDVPARVRVRDGRVVVRPALFARDALAARALIAQDSNHAQDLKLFDTGAGCPVPPPHAALVNASYQGAPAVLVYRPPMSGSQVVDLYVCGTHRPVRSTTLPHS